MRIEIAKLDVSKEERNKSSVSCFNFDNDEIRYHHVSTIIDRYTGYAEGLIYVKFGAMRKRALYYLQLEMIREMERFLGCRLKHKRRIIKQIHLLHFSFNNESLTWLRSLLFFFILPDNPAASTYALGYMLKEIMLESNENSIHIPEQTVYENYHNRYEQGILYLKERWI